MNIRTMCRKCKDYIPPENINIFAMFENTTDKLLIDGKCPQCNTISTYTFKQNHDKPELKKDTSVSDDPQRG